MRALLALLLLVALGCSRAPETGGRTRVGDIRVTLRDKDGARAGAAVITQVPDGVVIRGRVEGLPRGEHGMHFHASGDCTAPGFQSAGPHFNPTNAQHGIENPRGPHLGDLANLVIDADGTGEFIEFARSVTLTPGPNSLLRVGGTSLVIHAKPDDRQTEPAGNSGARIACGEIRR